MFQDDKELGDRKVCSGECKDRLSAVSLWTKWMDRAEISASSVNQAVSSALGLQ